MYSAEEIKRLIEAALPDAEVRVAGDDGVHFAALVVSSGFAGKGMVEQHRMVYAALGDRLGDEIHALSLRTLTPEQARG